MSGKQGERSAVSVTWDEELTVRLPTFALLVLTQQAHRIKIRSLWSEFLETCDIPHNRYMYPGERCQQASGGLASRPTAARNGPVNSDRRNVYDRGTRLAARYCASRIN